MFKKNDVGWSHCDVQLGDLLKKVNEIQNILSHRLPSGSKILICPRKLRRVIRVIPPCCLRDMQSSDGSFHGERGNIDGLTSHLSTMSIR